MPIHLPEESHWILGEINLQEKSIYLYDSWLPTQQFNSKKMKSPFDYKAGKHSYIIDVGSGVFSWIDCSNFLVVVF